jgi:hypothetical protein
VLYLEFNFEDNDERNTMSSDVPSDDLLEKIKDSIAIYQKTRESESSEKQQVKCPHHFGYLAERNDYSPFPEECLLCPQVVECMMPKSER